ncbi:MAG: histidine phosphatase family protein [Hyphomicrobiaceae bacterium]|nr:histidine phosphatase family protein [Hyphomicrobiaceae bacterium]
MVTLSLFRHAKSAWDSPALGDFDRPLAPRGEKAAPRMGRYMAAENLEPDIVLCSTAARARQTLELAAAEWTSSPEIRLEEGLYHAGPADMLRALRNLGEAYDHAMLIGHNPGMHALAINLSGTGDEAGLEAMEFKFPTAALAVIDFDGTWPAVATGQGRLRRFVVPRELKENE